MCVDRNGLRWALAPPPSCKIKYKGRFNENTKYYIKVVVLKRALGNLLRCPSIILGIYFSPLKMSPGAPMYIFSGIRSNKDFFECLVHFTLF